MAFDWLQIPFEPLEQVTAVDGKRYYKTPQGNCYKSVTTKLAEGPHPELDRWKERVGQVEADRISNQAATRGEALHRIAEKYLKNQTDYSKGEMPNNLALFQSIKPYLDKKINLIYATETAVYSDTLKVAGTTDMFCQWDSINTISDWKTSTRPKKEKWIEDYFIQTTVYALAIEELKPGLIIPQIAIIIAVENEEPQIFVKRKENYLAAVYKVFKNAKNQDLPFSQ